MAACCIGGVCIPYSALLPFLLMVLQYIARPLARMGKWSVWKLASTRVLHYYWATSTESFLVNCLHYFDIFMLDQITSTIDTNLLLSIFKSYFF